MNTKIEGLIIFIISIALISTLIHLFGIYGLLIWFILGIVLVGSIVLLESSNSNTVKEIKEIKEITIDGVSVNNVYKDNELIWTSNESK